MPAGSAREVFGAFLRLGLTSFGGPIAHLGYFREAFVVRRGWIDDAAYADLVALCQFLPGPASSQVGFAIGKRRAGLAGGIAAFLGFTAPSFALMAALAYWVVFRVMGKDYESAVMSAGMIGFGLGATSNALATMRVLVARYGPAPRAFLIVPIVGAFLIDFANALLTTTARNLFR